MRKATIEQWIGAWQALLPTYDDARRFEPAVETGLPDAFTNTRTSTLRRVGNLYLGTIEALKKHHSTGDFARAHALEDMMLVYDEAHAIRDPKATSVPPLLDFASRCGYRLLMTATPIFNSVADLDVLHLLLLGQKTASPDKRFDPEVDRNEIKAELTRVFQDTRRVVYQGHDPSVMPDVHHEEKKVYVDDAYAELARPVDDKGEIEKAKRVMKRQRYTAKLMQDYYAKKVLELPQDHFLSRARQETNQFKYEPLLLDILARAAGGARRVVVVSSFRGKGVDGFFAYVSEQPGVRAKVRLDYGGIDTLHRAKEADPSGIALQVAQWSNPSSASSTRRGTRRAAPSRSRCCSSARWR